MSFLEPLMLGLLAAAALPIIVHLYNRKRAVRRRFPALEFLLRSKKKLARQIKLRQLLLLILRVAFCLAIALAVAKPYIVSDTGISADEKLPSAVVYVFDDSFSMTADGGALYDSATEQLTEHVEALRPWDRAALIFASNADAPAVSDFTDDRNLIIDTVQAHAPYAGHVDLHRALEVARDLVITSQLPVRRVVLVTDRGAGSWPDRLDNNILGGLAHLELIDLGERPASNIAIVDASYQADPTGLSGSFEIVAQLRAFDLTETSEATVSLIIDGEPTASTTVTVSPEQPTSAIFTHSLAGERTVHDVTLSLSSSADTVPTDNDFHFPLKRTTRIEALLVNGDPRNVRYQDELFYLERALLPSDDSRSPITTRVTTPEAFNAERIGAANVIVLSNVARLSAPQINTLEDFVKAGGGLFISVGDKVEPSWYNQSLAPLLPRRLRDRKLLAELGDPDAVIKVTRFDTVDYSHAVLDVFSMPGGEGLQQVLVYSYMLVEPGTDSNARILASYSDGAPALIERRVDAGRVLLLTTTIDRDWSDLSIRKPFLPLSREMIRYLARRALGAQNELATIGQPHAINLSGQDPDRVIVSGPDERLVLSRAEIEAFDGTPTVIPTETGHYSVEFVEGDTAVPMPDLTFASNPDTAESDTQRIPTSTLENLWSGEPPPVDDNLAAQDSARRIELWPILLLLGLFFLYFETLIGLRRSFWTRAKRLFSREKADETALGTTSQL